MSNLHCWRRRKRASGNAPRARSARRAGDAAGPPKRAAATSSASHSLRKARRSSRGAIREAIDTIQAAGLRIAGPAREAAEVFEALHGNVERGGAVAGDLV